MCHSEERRIMPSNSHCCSWFSLSLWARCDISHCLIKIDNIYESYESLRVNVLKWFELRERERERGKLSSKIDPDYLRDPTIRHLLSVLVSLYRLWRNLDSCLMAVVRWGESCSTHLNFSWLFIHLIVVLCLLIFPKWLDFPEWEACLKWKRLQCLECWTLYKRKSKSRKVAGLRESGGILKRSDRPEDTRIIW